MDGLRNVIDISDGEADASNSSSYDFGQDFFENEIEDELRLMDVGQQNQPQPSGVRNPVDRYESCLRDILEVFPDISHDHVQQLHNKQMEVVRPHEQHEDMMARTLIDKILDAGAYPKEKDRIRELKRKRNDTDEEEAAKWKYMDLRENPAEYAKVARVALQEAFAFVPIRFIQDVFKEHGYYYGAFFAILKAERDNSSGIPGPFSRLKSRRFSNGPDAKTLIATFEADGFDFESLKKEMDSAFQRRKREDAQQLAVKEAERAEAARDQEDIAKGEVMDCGCCCETVPIPKMTHCNGDEPHFFCLDCARRNAENDIGNSQYKLKCMDFSDCNATFSREQRKRFLDEKTMEKLERLQQQEELRLAELDNLATCPFCDFAAICPPIEEDREFRCHNPQCEEISCRLCKLKSHIPLTCAEHKKENGVSERRVIEEARTEALVRTCSKCKVRILKEDGCNKVICTSCYAVLCDYCGKDITKAMYNHFDSESGRAPPGLITKPGGKCPLYDESNKRKDEQVEAAEKDAMAKVRADHPELSEEDLKIKFAKSVQQPSGRRHHHYGRPHDWIPPQPPHLHPHRQVGLFEGLDPLFGPRHADRPANPANAIPGVFPAVDEEQQRRLQMQHLQRQQQVAYQTYLQAQQRQQQRQAQQQQILAQQHQQLNQMRLQQQARVMQRAQDYMDQSQVRVQDYVDRNPFRAQTNRGWNGENFGGDDAPLGEDEALGFNDGSGNDDRFGFNEFIHNDFLDGPNQLNNHFHNDIFNRLAEEQNVRPQNPTARPDHRQATVPAPRAQLLRELDTAVFNPQPPQPPEPVRRNRPWL